MRGELRDINHNNFNYSVARGLFFTGDEAYVTEVYEAENKDELEVVLTGAEEKLTGVVYNQPEIDGVGANESLSILSEGAELPQSDEELEAFARFVLQQGQEESLEYTGPRELEDLEY